jgi:hypothetical protein
MDIQAAAKFQKLVKERFYKNRKVKAYPDDRLD